MRKFTFLKTILLLIAIVAGSGNVWGLEVTYKLEITSDDFNTTSYAANNGSHTKDAVCTTDNDKTFSVSYITYQIMKSGNNIQWQKSKGYIYNTTDLGTIASVTVTSSAGTFTTYYGTTEQPTSGTAGTGKGYFKTSVGSATGTASKIEVVFTITEIDDTKESTTTTITPSITNTDIYLSTAAGSLAAVVKKESDNSLVEGATVTWASDNEEVATIESTTGVITLTGLGDVTFTATYDGDEDHNGSNATYSMKVTSSAPDYCFYPVTSESQLSDGDLIIIVHGNNALSTTQNENNRSKADISSFNETSHFSIPVGNTTVQFLTLEGATGAWYFNTGSGYLYAPTDDKNYLRTETEKDNNAKATISISEGNATITFQGKNTRNILQYNSSNDIFSCYSGTMDDPQIYKATATFSLATACTDGEGMYYGTFSSSRAFTVPSDIIVSEVKLDASNKLVISDYASGDIVPANTGVMISSDVAGKHQVYYSDDTGTSVLGSANLLKATGDAGITAGDMNESDTKFYRLTMHNGTNLGFWWGAEDGAAFNMAANKAYLAVPNTAAAKGGFLLFDETTGIESLPQATSQKGEAEWYNLAGQRVAQPTRGLYIVGGKKVNVK